jgi:hypothetical protein
MKVRKLIDLPYDWRRFNLNVGGFTIKGVRWYPPTGQIVFPVRYSRNQIVYDVVHAYGRQVMRLRELLESGQMAAPRDRRPCKLTIWFRGRSRREREQGWFVFDFTVRGFTILWCRWQPASGSIQLPVTFFDDDENDRYVKKRVVTAYGAHILRLRRALEEACGMTQGEPEAVGEPAEPVVA